MIELWVSVGATVIRLERPTREHRLRPLPASGVVVVPLFAKFHCTLLVIFACFVAEGLALVRVGAKIILGFVSRSVCCVWAPLRKPYHT